MIQKPPGKGGSTIRFSSFEHILSYYARQTPDAAALIYEDKEKKICSFKELYETVNIRARELKAGGKTCIGILSDGSFDCIVTIFAANKAGLQIVMLDALAPEAVLRVLVTAADVDTLWGDNELISAVAPAMTSGVGDGNDKVLFFTSGTTSMAKAVTLTGHSLCQSAYNGGEMLPMSDKDVLINMLPLGHVFGFVCGLLWGLTSGAAVALGRGARHYADDLAFFRPTVLSAVPTLLGFLIKHRLVNPELKLVLVGAGDCPPPVLEGAAAMGLKVSFGYGLTETSSGVAISVEGDPCAMEVCPDDTITLAPDGEILIEAPTCMMQGYYKRPEDTAAVLTDGVFHTGDIGRYDGDGRLHIVGRKKEILVMGDGTKIFLPEYEAEISKALGASDVAVLLKNGRPCLVYQGHADADALWNLLRPVMDNYPRSQQLGEIIVTDTPLPRTATGKLKRWELVKFTSQGESK